MTISNKQRIVVLRRTFFMVSIVIAMAATALFLLDYPLPGMAMIGVFAIWFLYFQVADYQFIEFSDANNKIVLRYYKAIRLGKTNFNSIEFPQQMLYKVQFDNSIFGKLSDVTLIVKTSRGIADYPSVSLSAVSKEDRKAMQATLIRIMGM